MDFVSILKRTLTMNHITVLFITQIKKNKNKGSANSMHVDVNAAKKICRPNMHVTFINQY